MDTADLSRTSTTGNIRVLAVMESQWVTGPAKNLIAAGRRFRVPGPPERPAVEFSVITFDRPSSPAARFIAALENAGIATHIIRERHAGDPRVIPQLIGIVRSAAPDILQTHNSKSHLLVRLSGLADRIPWIAFFHGFTSKDAKDRFYNRIGLWAMRGAPQIVSVCRAFAGDLVCSGVPATRIAVRHNIVEPFVAPAPAEVAALRSQLGIGENTRVVLTVGRLSKEKGHADLLVAAAQLRAGGRCPNIRFILVGDGLERGALEQLTKKLGIGDCVLFEGHRDEVQAYYALADYFVLPSHSEGSPNALLEAMAAGLPIICTDAGGTAELVQDGKTALIVESKRPDKLGGAIRRLLEDREFAARLGGAAECASRGYTADSYCSAMAAIYGAIRR